MISLVLQVVLVLLLWLYQDSLLFNLAVLAVAVLAMVPLCLCPSHYNLRTAAILGFVGLFPQFVIVAIVLHLIGRSVLLYWLLRLL
jgi:hypothetical protein